MQPIIDSLLKGDNASRNKIRNLVDENNNTEIIKLLSQHNTNQYVQYIFGNYYMSKKDPESIKLAIKYLEPSADQGNSDSEYCLGVLYLYGPHVQIDKKRGLKYLDKSINQNHPEALSALGDYYLDIDYGKSFSYKKMAAAHAVAYYIPDECIIRLVSNII